MRYVIKRAKLSKLVKRKKALCAFLSYQHGNQKIIFLKFYFKSKQICHLKLLEVKFYARLSFVLDKLFKVNCSSAQNALSCYSSFGIERGRSLARRIWLRRVRKVWSERMEQLFLLEFSQSLQKKYLNYLMLGRVSVIKSFLTIFRLTSKGRTQWIA